MQSLSFEVVLDDHRHAVQRPRQARLGEAAVQLVSVLRRAGIDGDDGVDRRPVLVVGIDAADVSVHQPPARQTPGAHSVVDLGDGGFLHFEWRGGLGRQQAAAEQHKGRETKCHSNMMTDRPDAGMLAGRLFSRPGWKTGLQACGQRLQDLSGYSEREPGAELQLALYALSYNIDGPYKIDRPYKWRQEAVLSGGAAAASLTHLEL